MRLASHIRRRLAASVTAVAIAVVLVGASGVGASGVSAAGTELPASAAPLPVPVPASANVPHKFTHRAETPPTTANCQTAFGVACYSPKQYRRAYGFNTLYRQGVTGRGRTIAIVDAFGSPTIQQDLDVFDTDFGLAHTQVQIIQPVGVVPAFDPSNIEQQDWAFETTLDVEYAHAIAPDATILLVETPVSEAEGIQGFPEIVQAERYVVDHRLADVISQSFGATENTFPDPKGDIGRLRAVFKSAAKAHITVLGASGDTGVTDVKRDGETLYSHRVDSWPSSDPLVTSIGGTQLSLALSGDRLQKDVVWNDGYGAGGGGTSKVFSRPAFQNGVKKITGSHRGTPDISMSAAVDGSALVYLGLPNVPNLPAGYYLVGGTSEATPIFAGVVALADQLAEHRLGTINAALYKLDGKASKGIVDVTRGNNSFGGIKGYTAKRGYDLASGWGTINAPKFVKALAKSHN
ncbi:S8 family serine peptidase [uncultured Amnibacterium sp.]|uniref:S53 family peptidase n=1 Tax=uncultured Amnibacterium sp. TaxID=1631851 RepID=UPI0035CBBC61